MNTQNIWRPLQFFMGFFNIKNIGLITLIIISFAVITEGCGKKKGTSEVTIVISDSQEAALKIKIRKPSLFASIKNRLRKIIDIREAFAIPSNVTSIRYTISASDMETMEGTVSVSATTQTIVLDVPQGPQRYFVLEALDANGLVYYRGETYADLEDIEITLTILMAPASNGLVWPKQLGTSSNDYAAGIATDWSGDVYITGYTYGSLDGYTNSGYSDLYIIKYDTNGARLWIRQLGTSSYDYAMGIATDSSGNVYVTGYTYGSLGATNLGEGDIFLVKYNSSGTWQWTQQLGTALDDRAIGVATDMSGNVYVTGYTYGNLSGSSSEGPADIFLVKYNSSGTWQWTQQLGSTSYDYAMGIATDWSSNVYVTGYTYGDLDGNTNSGGADIFLVKYNSSGTKQWTQQPGTTSNDYAIGATSDRDGNVYITGFTYGGLDGSTNSGLYDIFLSKYNSTGIRLWTSQFGTANNEMAYSVTADAGGAVYVAGATYGDLDGNVNAGNADAFLVKYDFNGTRLWTSQFGTAEEDRAYGITKDWRANVFLTGITEGALDRNTNAGFYDIFTVKYNANGTL